ncbi:hypothetical protein [Dyadobacter sp. LHD-138]|uniref:hypothetical protein n=1 Tax=Dyadobacter sp. LHD-138 TaxID=3071413 RepID=UPI0027E01549|nr:hypothetical protein [Dyadobacter sp. LHD-138]MDQ6480112.1 hypothetical protein [Dyadobacter sp. LHD-138]
MLSDISELLRCKKIIEQKLDWGDSENWQSSDFENLNQLILDKTGVSLSVSTLRRIWGRVEYNHLPSVTTLNTLAKFAGFEDWRNFMKKNASEPDLNRNPSTEKKTRIHSGSLVKFAWIFGLAVFTGLITILAFDKGQPQLKSEEYAFSSQPITKGIPNSVIFTYDASKAPGDSIFIQQSWDKRRRTVVEKNLHKHTSIYYEPGFYIAKLIVGEQIVKEHKLLVPTTGWLGTIDGPTIPVYLKNREFMADSILQLPVSVIATKNIPMQPQTPNIHYYNVGNFEPVSIKNFNFSSEIKNEFRDGAGACQLSAITLITDDIPIVIPFSAKGCVSELNFLSIDNFISGKKEDLSAFGADFSDWVKVSCKSSGTKIQYSVNNKQVLELPLPARDIHVVGLAYTFQGTGAVKKVSLSSQNKIIFQAF